MKRKHFSLSFIFFALFPMHSRVPLSKGNEKQVAEAGMAEDAFWVVQYFRLAKEEGKVELKAAKLTWWQSVAAFICLLTDNAVKSICGNMRAPPRQYGG